MRPSLQSWQSCRLVGPLRLRTMVLRSYWNARAGTNVVSFQYLDMSIGASASNAFAPGQYIYPSSTTHANVIVGTWAHHMTFHNRPSTFAVNLIGGNADVGMNTNSVPPEFLPPDITPGTTLSQSSSGFADPNMALRLIFLELQNLRVPSIY